MYVHACTCIGLNRHMSPFWRVLWLSLCCFSASSPFHVHCSCIAISFLVEKMPLKWVLNHQLCFIMALMFVLLDLTGEVSAGTITRAKKLIDKLLTRCNTPLPEDLKVG